MNITKNFEKFNVELDRYNDCINFTFTYKVLGILKTGIGTIDKEGNLVLEGQLCSHREMKEVKGLVPIYLEAGTPTE